MTSVGQVSKGHVVLKVHDALGISGRSGGIHPERHIVAVGVGGRQMIGKIPQPLTRLLDFDVGDCRTCPAVDNDQRSQLHAEAKNARKLLAERRLGQRHLGARVSEIELQQIRRREDVDQDGNQPRADDAEERRWINRSVIEQQNDAVAAVQPQRQQSVTPSRRIGGELSVAAPARGADDSEMIAASCSQVLEENFTRVVAFRKSEADLRCAGAIPRNLVEERGRMDCRRFWCSLNSP